MNKNNVLILATSSLLLAPALFADTPFNVDEWILKPADEKSIIQLTNDGHIDTHTSLSEASFTWNNNEGKTPFVLDQDDAVSIKFSMKDTNSASVIFDLGKSATIVKSSINFLVETKDGKQECWLTYNGEKTTALSSATGEMSLVFTRLPDDLTLGSQVSVSAYSEGNLLQTIIAPWVPETNPKVTISSSDKGTSELPGNGHIVFTSFEYTKDGSIPEPTTATLSLLGLASLLLRRRRA